MGQDYNLRLKYLDYKNVRQLCFYLENKTRNFAFYVIKTFWPVIPCTSSMLYQICYKHYWRIKYFTNKCQIYLYLWEKNEFDLFCVNCTLSYYVTLKLNYNKFDFINSILVQNSFKIFVEWCKYSKCKENKKSLIILLLNRIAFSLFLKWVFLVISFLDSQLS